MPTGLKRYQESRELHFITFTCYHSQPYMAAASTRDLFEEVLEQTRRLYRYYIAAYVVMPEHVHLLVTEPERRLLSTALQALKQAVARRQNVADPPFWQTRYYDRNIWSSKAFEDARQYIHQNPVQRGLVASAEDWPWSSARHHTIGEKRVVEVESQWTARERKRAGIDVKFKFVLSHPSKTS